MSFQYNILKFRFQQQNICETILSSTTQCSCICQNFRPGNRTNNKIYFFEIKNNLTNSRTMKLWPFPSNSNVFSGPLWYFIQMTLVSHLGRVQISISYVHYVLRYTLYTLTLYWCHHLSRIEFMYGH